MSFTSKGLPIALSAVLLSISGVMLSPNPSAADEDSQIAPTAKSNIAFAEIDFKKNLDPKDVFQLAEASGVAITEARYDLGGAHGIYIYDPTATPKTNATNLSEQLSDFNSNPLLVGLTIIDKDKSSSEDNKQLETRGLKSTSSKARADLEEQLKSLTPRKQTLISETAVRENVPSVEPNGDHSANPSTDQARTSATATEKEKFPVKEKWASNRVIYQTKDNVKGQRQISMEAAWFNGNSPRKLPDKWGWEMKFYQMNYNMSGNNDPTKCPADRSSRFWANLTPFGKTISYRINGKESSPDPYKFYYDWDSFLDTCQQGTIGVGVGKASNLPDLKNSDGGRTTHADLWFVIRSDPGKSTWSHIWTAQKAAYDTCSPALPINSACMGAGGSWNKSEFGRYDIPTLNKDRKWRTPTYFKWDTFESESPIALKQM